MQAHSVDHGSPVLAHFVLSPQHMHSKLSSMYIPAEVWKYLIWHFEVNVGCRESVQNNYKDFQSLLARHGADHGRIKNIGCYFYSGCFADYTAKYNFHKRASIGTPKDFRCYDEHHNTYYDESYNAKGFIEAVRSLNNGAFDNRKKIWVCGTNGAAVSVVIALHEVQKVPYEDIYILGTTKPDAMMVCDLCGIDKGHAEPIDCANMNADLCPVGILINVTNLNILDLKIKLKLEGKTVNSRKNHRDRRGYEASARPSRRPEYFIFNLNYRNYLGPVKVSSNAQLTRDDCIKSRISHLRVGLYTEFYRFFASFKLFVERNPSVDKNGKAKAFFDRYHDLDAAIIYGLGNAPWVFLLKNALKLTNEEAALHAKQLLAEDGTHKMQQKEEEVGLCATRSILEETEGGRHKMELKEEEIDLCANQFLAEDGTHKMEQKEEEISLCANQSLLEEAAADGIHKVSQQVESVEEAAFMSCCSKCI